MARYVGKDLVVYWIITGGTVDLSADFRTLTTSEKVADVDATAGADTYAFHLPTFSDADTKLELLDNSSHASTYWGSIAPRLEGTLMWYPLGTASGKTYHKMAAYISGRDRKIPYADVVDITLAFQSQSAPSDNVA
jgi:hypothetical protein